MINDSLIEKLEHEASFMTPQGKQAIARAIEIIRQHTAAHVEAVNHLQSIQQWCFNQTDFREGPIIKLLGDINKEAKAAIAAMGGASTSTKEGVTSPAKCTGLGCESCDTARSQASEISVDEAIIALEGGNFYSDYDRACLYLKALKAALATNPVMVGVIPEAIAQVRKSLDAIEQLPHGLSMEMGASERECADYYQNKLRYAQGIAAEALAALDKLLSGDGHAG